MFDPKTKPVDWAVFRHGGRWSLFTLACLVHHLDPRAVLDDAHLAIRKHGGPSSEVLNDPKAAAAMLYAVPEMYLIEPVGATLERMKGATGLPYSGTISSDQARTLADSLGLTFPAELMPTPRQQAAPEPQAATPSAAPVVLKPFQRQAAQNAAVLDAIRRMGHEPLALPKWKPGKPGVKAAVCAALKNNPLFGGRVFDKTWDRLRAGDEIADKP